MPLLVNFFETPTGIVDLIFAILLAGLIVYCAVRCKFSLVSIITLSILFVLSIVFYAVGIQIASYFVFVITIAVLFISSLSHIGSIRTFFDKTFKPNQITKKTGPEKLLNRDAVYNEVYEAVASCSRQKIGVLITFEKHDDLEKVTKNGSNLIDSIKYIKKASDDNAKISKRIEATKEVKKMSDNEIRKALLGLCKGLDAVGQTVIKQAKDIKKIKMKNITLTAAVSGIVVVGYKAFKEVNARLVADENALKAYDEELDFLIKRGK